MVILTVLLSSAPRLGREIHRVLTYPETAPGMLRAGVEAKDWSLSLPIRHLKNRAVADEYSQYQDTFS